MTEHEPRLPADRVFLEAHEAAFAAMPGAIEAMRVASHIPPESLLRHEMGDWGTSTPTTAASTPQSWPAATASSPVTPPAPASASG